MASAADSPSKRRRRDPAYKPQSRAVARLLESSSESSTPTPPSVRAKRSAAKKVLRVYRRFRAGLPGGGQIYSRSSTISAHRLRRADFADALGEEFGKLLIAFARMTGAGKDEFLLHHQPMVRGHKVNEFPNFEVHPTEGWLVVTNAQGRHWSKLGYQYAHERCDVLHELTVEELNMVAITFQVVHAPQVMMRILGKAVPPRVLNDLDEQKTPETVRPGGLPHRTYEPLPGGDPRSMHIVGAPGDRFRLPKDMVRFLTRALGGFHRYRWAMNPRRRRRVRGRPQRWMLHTNNAMNDHDMYRVLRFMYQSQSEVALLRGWSHLFPRPFPHWIEYSMGARDVYLKTIRRSIRDLIANYLVPEQSEVSTRGSFLGVSRTASSSRSRSRRTPPILRSNVSPDGPVPSPDREGASYVAYAAGIFSAGTRERLVYHATVWYARMTFRDGRAMLHFIIMDPHGKITVSPSLFERIEDTWAEEIGSREDLARHVGFNMKFMPVPAYLAVQYRHEGSCMVATLALLMSTLRVLRRRRTDHAAKNSEIARECFEKVREEDMVVAAQLAHNHVGAK